MGYALLCQCSCTWKWGGGLLIQTVYSLGHLTYGKHTKVNCKVKVQAVILMVNIQDLNTAAATCSDLQPSF